jgi:hypothetical protein
MSRLLRADLKVCATTLLLLGGLTVAGCASPEAARGRGEGPGADVGNRPALVRMHAGSDPFWKTPNRIPAEHGPLDSARQARERSTGNSQ